MSRVAFYLFDFPIYWYGIIIAFSVILAVMIGVWLCKRIGYKDEIPYEVMLAAVPLGFVFARLYFIIFSSGVGLADFFAFRDGGIAIYGGIIGGALGILIYTKLIRKCGFFAITDLLVIGVILAQSIGRWGNFFNQEVYGFAVSINFFPLTVMISGTPHLALFFYESILNLLGFVILLKVFSHSKKIGTTSAVYLIWYGIVRAVLEPFREAAFQLMIGPFPVSLVVSFFAIAIGVLILYLGKVGFISQKNVTLLAKSSSPKKKET